MVLSRHNKNNYGICYRFMFWGKGFAVGYTAYDGFLAYIYGYCPYFGRDRARSANLYLSEVERISASTVLELGTADGSITIPFLKKGFIVDTVDFSDDMHQIVKEKLNNYHKEVLGQINFICSDITKFNTKKTYGAIMIPDSILTVIQKSDGVQHILQMCRDALDDKGILLLDIYIPITDLAQDNILRDVVRFKDGNHDIYVLEVEHRIDESQQLQTSTYKYRKRLEINKYEEAALITLEYHYMYLSQIISLLEKVGFTVIQAREELGQKIYFITARKRIMS